MLGNLSKILNDDSPAAEHPLGVLTTQNRDEWAKHRDYLEATGNSEVLNKIDSAIFNLVFDDDVINDDKRTILKKWLHSDGTNRYVIVETPKKKLNSLPNS